MDQKMDLTPDPLLPFTRRRFLELSSTGVGAAALATLWNGDLLAQVPPAGAAATGRKAAACNPHCGEHARYGH